VFLAAVGLTVALTLLIAMTVTGPIRRLAEAADQVRRQKGPVTAGLHAEIPVVGTPYDEIGILSQSLRDMTGALEKRIDAIARFAADVAHELKNPLTSLASAVESLPIAPEGPGRERLVEIIQHDVKRLDRLITDISAASRLDAELSRAEAGRVDIADLLRGLVDLERDTRGPGEAEVVLEIDTGSLPSSALTVRGIESRLGQVFTNIIENAISFSPTEGTVRVHARLDQTAEGRMVRITVEDDGPGIPEDNLETIFERFYTERPDAEDFGKNSGLGLSISRQIVEAHGGRVFAENRRESALDPVRGARIVVILPARRGKGA
jgi:two-component system sensor histidine kinase ChvG